MNLVLDFDDTLFDFGNPCADALSHYTNKPIGAGDWPDYDLCALYGITREEFLRVLVDYKVLESCRPQMGAYTLMQYVTHNPVNLTIVTHRGWHPHGSEITKWSMDKWFPNVGFQLVVQNLHELKSSVVLDPHMMFDDNPRVIADMQAIHPNCRTYLIKQPSNREHHSGLHAVEFSKALHLVTARHKELQCAT